MISEIHHGSQSHTNSDRRSDPRAERSTTAAAIASLIRHTLIASVISSPFEFPLSAQFQIFSISSLSMNFKDALDPIMPAAVTRVMTPRSARLRNGLTTHSAWITFSCRSEEHTSELQSRFDLVCRLL